MLTWRKYRADYLDSCLVLEGRGRFHNSCANPRCGSEMRDTPNFRCLDCFGYAMVCKQCIVSVHHILPLHRIEVREEILPYMLKLITLVIGMENHFLSTNNSTSSGGTSTTRSQSRSIMPLSPKRT